MDATAKFLAVIAVAAFVTERILAAVSYLMNAFRLSRVRPGIAVRLRSKEQRKLVLFFIAAVIAYVVVDRANLRLLHVLQVEKVNPLIDFWLTWLVVLAGADRVHSMVGGAGQGTGAADSTADTPVIRIQVDGGEVRDLHRVS